MKKLIELPTNVVKTLQIEGKKNNLKVKPFIESILIEKAKELIEEKTNGNQN